MPIPSRHSLLICSLLLLHACRQQHADYEDSAGTMGVQQASLRLPQWVTIKDARAYQLNAVSGRMIGILIDPAEEVVAFEEGIVDPQGSWTEVRRVVTDATNGLRTLSARYFVPTTQLEVVGPARGIMLADGFSVVKPCPWYAIENQRLVLQPDRIHHEFMGTDGQERRFIEFFDAADDQSPFVLVGKDNHALGFMSRWCLNADRIESQRLVMERRMRVHAVKHPLGWPVYPSGIEDARNQVEASRGQAGFVDWPFRGDPDLYLGPNDPFQEYCPGVTYPTSGTAGDIQNMAIGSALGVDDLYTEFNFYLRGVSDRLDQDYGKVVDVGGSGWAEVANWEANPKPGIEPHELQQGFCKAIKIVMQCLWLRGFFQAEFYLNTQVSRKDPLFRSTVEVTNDWIAHANHNFTEVPLLTDALSFRDLFSDPEVRQYIDHDLVQTSYMLLQRRVPETNRRAFFVDLSRGFVCDAANAN